LDNDGPACSLGKEMDHVEYRDGSAGLVPLFSALTAYIYGYIYIYIYIYIYVYIYHINLRIGLQSKVGSEI